LIGFVFSSLDKELVKLAEKSAREREQREREKRERDNQANKLPKTEPSSNQIQVKPIIETISSDQKPKYPKSSHVKMTNGDLNGNTTEDLLRFVIVDENKEYNFICY